METMDQATTTQTPCPVCSGPLHERRAMNSLSRADNHTYICSRCGQREALLIGTGTRGGRRECLYHDEVGGIMLVTEDEPGYVSMGAKPPDAAVAQSYCTAWNTTLGLSPDDVNDIVASSMFGRWANF